MQQITFAASVDAAWKVASHFAWLKSISDGFKGNLSTWWFVMISRQMSCPPPNVFEIEEPLALHHQLPELFLGKVHVLCSPLMTIQSWDQNEWAKISLEDANCVISAARHRSSSSSCATRLRDFVFSSRSSQRPLETMLVERFTICELHDQCGITSDITFDFDCRLCFCSILWCISGWESQEAWRASSRKRRMLVGVESICFLNF